VGEEFKRMVVVLDSTTAELAEVKKTDIPKAIKEGIDAGLAFITKVTPFVDAADLSKSEDEIRKIVISKVMPKVKTDGMKSGELVVLCDAAIAQGLPTGDGNTDLDDDDDGDDIDTATRKTNAQKQKVMDSADTTGGKKADPRAAYIARLNGKK
jgi:hypothetical protein